MIIANGTIEPKIKTGGGVDRETGHPIASTSSFGTPIPCQIIANQYNALALSLGEHVTLASYQVLIDQQEFSAEQVRMKDETGKVIGEFSIKHIEPLKAVYQIRLWI